MSAPMPLREPRISPTMTPITVRASPVRSPPTSVNSIAGSITLTNTTGGRAPNARATVIICGFTCRMPASTASVIGKKPSRKPKAIFEAAPSPKKSISDGYQTTAGTA